MSHTFAHVVQQGCSQQIRIVMTRLPQRVEYMQGVLAVLAGHGHEQVHRLR